MSMETKPNRCFKCQKIEGTCNCTGCKAFFCVKHFIDHRHELMNQLDDDVGVKLNQLLEQFDKLNQPDASSVDCFSQIDRWETEAIANIRKTATEIRRQLIELTTEKHNKLNNKFKDIKNEIHRRRTDEEFVEPDIERFKEELEQIQWSLEELTQPKKK